MDANDKVKRSEGHSILSRGPESPQNSRVCIFKNAILDQESGFVLLLKPPSSDIPELFLEGTPGEANVDLPGADLLGELLVQPPAVHHLLPLLAHLQPFVDLTILRTNFYQLYSEELLEVEMTKDLLENIRVETSLRSE